MRKEYGLDPFSKVGIEKAREIARQNPNARFICTAEGCSQIATNAADAYGNDFYRGNAWDLGNKNSVIYQNPVYAGAIGQGILPDPTAFTAPSEMYSAPGSIIGLNRANNRVAGAKNDSYDYADQSVYPKSRGYEHVGYLIDQNTLLHGTGAGGGHPAYYTIDDVRNGVKLPGYGSYQPVEAIQAGNPFTFGYDYLQKKMGFKGGGTYYQGMSYADGGDIPNYMKDPNPMYNFGGYFPQAPRMKKGGVTQQGGIVVGETYDASPELLRKLKNGGYTFEYVD